MPHPAILTRENAALAIIDFQEKLVPMVWKKDEVLKNAGLMIKAAGIYGIPILMTEHYPRGLGVTVPEVKELLPGTRPFEKVIFSAFGSNEFHETLTEMGIETLIIIGIESHICVNQTAHDALELGFKVHIISDAVSSRTERDHWVGIEKMRTSGAIISSTETALYELQYRADTPEFKELLRLVK